MMPPPSRATCNGLLATEASLLGNGSDDGVDWWPIGRVFANIGVDDFLVWRDDVGRRSSDALADVFDCVGADGVEFWVAEKREAERELLRKGLTIFDRFVADGDQSCFFALKPGEACLQLTELLTAIGSPMAPVEDEDNRARSKSVG